MRTPDHAPAWFMSVPVAILIVPTVLIGWLMFGGDELAVGAFLRAAVPASGARGRAGDLAKRSRRAIVLCVVLVGIRDRLRALRDRDGAARTPSNGCAASRCTCPRCLTQRVLLRRRDRSDSSCGRRELLGTLLRPHRRSARASTARCARPSSRRSWLGALDAFVPNRSRARVRADPGLRRGVLHRLLRVSREVALMLALVRRSCVPIVVGALLLLAAEDRRTLREQGDRCARCRCDVRRCAADATRQRRDGASAGSRGRSSPRSTSARRRISFWIALLLALCTACAILATNVPRARDFIAHAADPRRHDARALPGAKTCWSSRSSGT